MILCLLPTFSGALRGGQLTYRCRAAATPQVLAEISKLAGVPLNAQGDAKSEIILIDVKDVPLSFLMQKIAYVTSCEWKESGDGYTLEPDLGRQKLEEKQELKARADRIRTLLNTRFQSMRAMENTPGILETKDVTKVSDAQFKSISKRLFIYDPAEMACLSICSNLSRELLADLPFNRKAVWVTNNPSDYQTELSYEATAAISHMVSERNLMADEGLYPEPITATIRKAKLTVRPVRDEIAVSIACYDDQWKAVTGANGGFILPLGDAYPTADKMDTSLSENPEAKTLQLDPDSIRILKLYSSEGYGDLLPQLRRSLRNDVSDVANHDPLSYFPSDLLLYYGAKSNHQIVAALPDGFFKEAQEAENRITPEQKNSEVLKGVTEGTSLTITTQGSSTLIRPYSPQGTGPRDSIELSLHRSSLIGRTPDIPA